MQTKHYETPFVCTDIDFNTVLEMVKILVQHAAKVFSSPARRNTTNTAEQSNNGTVSDIASTVTTKLPHSCKSPKVPQTSGSQSLSFFLVAKPFVSSYLLIRKKVLPLPPNCKTLKL
jgi:hypothetical protein